MMDYESLLSGAGRRMQESAIRKMGTLLTQARDVISFAPVYPDSATFAWSEFREIASDLLRGDDGTVLQYGPTRGHRPLLEVVTAIMASRGIAVNIADLLVTTGSQQGIDLLARVLLDPRDWGVGATRDFEWGNFALSYTTGTGMPLEFDGNYLLSARISKWVLGRDNYNLGFSTSYGKTLDTMGYLVLNPNPQDYFLVDADFTYLWNNIENRFEVAAGERMDDGTYALFWRIGVNLLEEDRLKPSFSPYTGSSWRRELPFFRGCNV